MNKALRLPSELVKHVTAILSERGVEWVESLPALVAKLEKDWSVEVQQPFEAGEFNFVAPASQADGKHVVLKIAPPYDDGEYIREAEFLRQRAGRGAVLLLAQDLESRAILLERARPGRNLAELFTGKELDAIDPAIDVLRSITELPPDDLSNIKTVDDWFGALRQADDTAFPAGYAVRALELYERLAPTGPALYLHGDFHPGNVVSASRSPYLAIDPKGVVGPIGYDIAVFLNNFYWWQETKPDIHDRLERAIGAFSDAFEIDPFELREWAYAQMVLGAWWSFEDMPQHYDHRAVAKADIWNV